MRSFWFRCAAALCVMASALPAHAGLVSQGLYRLHNELDGVSATFIFTLEPDELFDVAPEHDLLTLDFDRTDATAFLDFGVRGLRLARTAQVGLDAGFGYDSMRSSQAELDLDHLTAASTASRIDGANTGFITWLGTGEIIPLWDKGSSADYWFRFADQDEHRGAGLSGWFWMTQASFGQHVMSSSDWLLTAELTATPSGPAALGFGPFAGRQW